MPICAKVIRPTSPARLWLAAAYTPASKAITVVNSMAKTASGTVRDRRSAINSVTGVP